MIHNYAAFFITGLGRPSAQLKDGCRTEEQRSFFSAQTHTKSHGK